MKLSAWLVDAFTTQTFQGNPAGVIPQASGLSPMQMQMIAREIHASETAFILEADSPEADFRLRFFTPESEVDLCGHATIGAVCGLVEEGNLSLEENGGVCKVQTQVGVLTITYGKRDGFAWAEMRQAEPKFRNLSLDKDLIAGLLGIAREDFAENLVSGLSYTGLWDLFIPVTSLEVMSKMQPKLAELAIWNRAINVVSTHVYTTDTVDTHHDFHTRDFSPAVGIAEDPATGTATGALTALLYEHGLVQASQSYQFEQGYEIKRPSVIQARIETGSDGVLQVYVKGSAVRSLSGSIYL